MDVRKTALRFIVLFLGLAFLGCTQHRVSTDVAQLQKELMAKENKLSALEQSNQRQAETISEYQMRLDEQARLESEARMMSEASAQKSLTQSPLLPPDAKPGECFARVLVPAEYRTVAEQRLKLGASERIETIPAKYEWVEEKVLVRGASERLEMIPAKYDWVEEQVLTREASTRLEKMPAEFEWVEDRILVKEAETVWKKGRGLIEKVNTTGEIMCLVEIPAQYKTVKNKVMVKPPATRTIEIPAEYKTVKKEVMVTPPSTRVIQIPAEYKTIKVKKMVSPAREERFEIPAEYQTVSKTELVKPGHMEWRRVMCETNITGNMVTRIQAALLKAGHDPGPIDGILGKHTNAAIKSFQKEKNIAVGGLTYETIRNLGVEPGV